VQRCPSVQNRSYTTANAHDGGNEAFAAHFIESRAQTADVHPSDRADIEDLRDVAFRVDVFRVDNF
jgi:hypothetical protein